eukprot:7292052-Pyramimonas_sp.AAC.1
MPTAPRSPWLAGRPPCGASSSQMQTIVTATPPAQSPPRAPYHVNTRVYTTAVSGIRGTYVYVVKKTARSLFEGGVKCKPYSGGIATVRQGLLFCKGSTTGIYRKHTPSDVSVPSD